MGADICVQTESPARTYGRPALGNSFAALPADSRFPADSKGVAASFAVVALHGLIALGMRWGGFAAIWSKCVGAVPITASQESCRKIKQTLLRAVNTCSLRNLPIPLTQARSDIVEYLEQRKVAAMRESVPHRIAIVVVAAALGCAAMATDAVARAGGGAGHGGGGMGGGHFGGGRFAGRFEHGHHRRVRGLEIPFGYYDDGYSGYYDPSTVAPDEQPVYPITAYPYVTPPRSRCSTQPYKVPSEAGGEASVNVVRC